MMGKCLYTTLLGASLMASTLNNVHGFVSQQRAFSSPMNLQMVSTQMESWGENGEHKERRVAEFMNLEPVTMTDARKARLDRDQENKEQFVEYGDQLWSLRKKMEKLGDRLVGVLNGNSEDSEQLLRHELLDAELRDPELVYEMQLLEMELAMRDGDMEHAEKSKQRALNARSCLPHYNLEGLWVGKYGNHGYEMINVTYIGDTMIAYKVTGDKNVPREEITFQADLTPNEVKKLRDGHYDDVTSNGKAKSDNTPKPLEPITLTEKAASKWGTRQLPRYRGLGQVAEPGFLNSKWMDGQLIIIGEDYFSFAWVPLENQIFFGRPSPELALKMLREGGKEDLRIKTHWDAPPSMDDDVDVLKEYVLSCLEKTALTHEEEMPVGDPFGCIWHGNSDTEECYFE